MPDTTFRRRYRKPTDVVAEQIDNFRRRLTAALERQRRLAESHPGFLRLLGELSEDADGYFIEHEPADAVATADPFDPASPAVAAADLDRMFAHAWAALSAAHGAGPEPLIHGGLSPQVILRAADGRYCVADFGVAPAYCAAFGSDHYRRLGIATGGTSATGVWECLEDRERERADRLMPFIAIDKYVRKDLAGFEPTGDVYGLGLVACVLADRRQPMLEPGDQLDSELHTYIAGIPPKRFVFRRSDLSEAWVRSVTAAIDRERTRRPSAAEIAAALKPLAQRPGDYQAAFETAVSAAWAEIRGRHRDWIDPAAIVLKVDPLAWKRGETGATVQARVAWSLANESESAGRGAAGEQTCEFRVEDQSLADINPLRGAFEKWLRPIVAAAQQRALDELPSPVRARFGALRVVAREALPAATVRVALGGEPEVEPAESTARWRPASKTWDWDTTGGAAALSTTALGRAQRAAEAAILPLLPKEAAGLLRLSVELDRRVWTWEQLPGVLALSGRVRFQRLDGRRPTEAHQPVEFTASSAPDGALALTPVVTQIAARVVAAVDATRPPPVVEAPPAPAPAPSASERSPDAAARGERLAQAAEKKPVPGGAESSAAAAAAAGAKPETGSADKSARETAPKVAPPAPRPEKGKEAAESAKPAARRVDVPAPPGARATPEKPEPRPVPAPPEQPAAEPGRAAAEQARAGAASKRRATSGSGTGSTTDRVAPLASVTPASTTTVPAGGTRTAASPGGDGATRAAKRVEETPVPGGAVREPVKRRGGALVSTLVVLGVVAVGVLSWAGGAFDEWFGSPPPPPPPVATGACCLGVNGTAPCSVLTRAECEAQNGVYRGDEVACTAELCPPPPAATGACCVGVNGTRPCRVLTRAECEAQKGVYRGDSVACTAELCPPPPAETGACCVGPATARTCEVLTRAVCVERGGDYRGDDVACSAELCPSSAPQPEPPIVIAPPTDERTFVAALREFETASAANKPITIDAKLQAAFARVRVLVGGGAVPELLPETVSLPEAAGAGSGSYRKLRLTETGGGTLLLYVACAAGDAPPAAEAPAALPTWEQWRSIARQLAVEADRDAAAGAAPAIGGACAWGALRRDVWWGEKELVRVGTAGAEKLAPVGGVTVAVAGAERDIPVFRPDAGDAAIDAWLANPLVAPPAGASDAVGARYRGVIEVWRFTTAAGGTP